MKKTNYKIVVLGDSGCGKTALVKRFVRNEVVTNYDPTIEDKYTKKLQFQGTNVNLEIVDTSGRELLPDMLSRYIAFADAFVVCYSVGSRRSFERAVELFDQIAQQRQVVQIARVLVGCKCDSDFREVHPDEGNDLSAHLQCSFAETSAVQNLNVHEVFDECVSQLNYIKILRTTPGPAATYNNDYSNPAPYSKGPVQYSGPYGGGPSYQPNQSYVDERQWYPAPSKGSRFCCFL